MENSRAERYDRLLATQSPVRRIALSFLDRAFTYRTRFSSGAVHFCLLEPNPGQEGKITALAHGRELRGKNVRIRSGQYLVYHFTAKDFVRCTPEGGTLDGFNEIGYVFKDFSEAQNYSRWKVNQNPKIGCVIYDHSWKVVSQFANPQYRES